MAYQEAEKTHNGTNLKQQKEKSAMMAEQPGSMHCPVASFKKYVSYLNPDSDALYQILNKYFE